MGLPCLGQWMGASSRDCPFDLAQGKQAERLAQPTEGMGLREWVGSWRKLERLDQGTVVRCELEEGRDWRAALGWGVWPGRVPTRSGSAIVEAGFHRSEREPVFGQRIRRPWQVAEGAAIEEVASGEWRVTSLGKKQVPQA